jgi:hypothetical protein
MSSILADINNLSPVLFWTCLSVSVIAFTLSVVDVYRGRVPFMKLLALFFSLSGVMGSISYAIING